MPSDEFNYIDDSLIHKKKNKKIKFIIILLVIIALAAGTYFFILPNLSHERNKTTEKLPETVVGDDKIYDKESGLIVPKEYTKQIYHRGNLTLDINDIKADKTGYTIDLTFNNTGGNQVTMNCISILIDGFETNANFTATSYENNSSSTSVTIPKTELDLLEINDFNSLTFLIEFTSPRESLNFNETISLNVYQSNPVDNKKNIIKFDELEDLDISVYDKKEDAEYSYIYFDIKNKSYEDIYKIMINKLYVNGIIYNYDDLEEIVHYQADKIFYLKIPKSQYHNVEKINISFFFVKNKDTQDQAIIISNLKEIIVNNL